MSLSSYKGRVSYCPQDLNRSLLYVDSIPYTLFSMINWQDVKSMVTYGKRDDANDAILLHG